MTYLASRSQLTGRLLADTLQASGGATDLTVGNELDELTDAFTLAAATIANTAVSSGDTTNFPTNDDISITYAVALQ